MTAKSNDQTQPQPGESPADPPADPLADPLADAPKRPREVGGPKGPEPTRYGDWEIGGRCTDF